MGSELVLIPRIFIHMRRNKNRVALGLRRHRNGTTDLCAGPLRSLNNLLSGLVDQTMIKSFEPNSDALVLHTTNISRIVKERALGQPNDCFGAAKKERESYFSGIRMSTTK